jgi:hypothetical protein
MVARSCCALVGGDCLYFPAKFAKGFAQMKRGDVAPSRFGAFKVSDRF